MIRVLFFLFLFGLCLANTIFAQNPLAQRYFQSGTSLAQAGDYYEAIKSYKKSLDLDRAENNLKTTKFQSKIYYNIGVCYFQINKLQKAERAFARSISINPDKEQNGLYALGLVQLDLAKPDLAKRSFKAVLKINKHFGEAWFDLGMILLAENDLLEAQKSFDLAIINKSKREAEAINNLGVISFIKGDFALAEINFRRAILLSKSEFLIAKDNLNICRTFKKYQNEKLIASLKFTNKKGAING